MRINYSIEGPVILYANESDIGIRIIANDWQLN